MLSKRDFDVMVVGKSYLSYLLAHMQARSGKNTVIIDDPRVGHSGSVLGHMGLIEREFLRLWGEKYSLEPLCQIHKYLSPCPLYLHLDEQRLLLGGTAAYNMLELARKHTDLFVYGEDFYIQLQTDEAKEKFNSEFDEYGRRVAQYLLSPQRPKKYKRSSLEWVFTDNIPPVFSQLYQHIAHFYYGEHKKSPPHLSGPQKWKLTGILYLAQCFLQGKYTEVLSEFELYHLLYSLLSPRFNLDEAKLLQDLEASLELLNCPLKMAPIASWRQRQGRLQGVQLDSFEGVLQAPRAYYVGGPHEEVPFQLSLPHKKDALYAAGWLQIHYPTPIFAHMQTSRLMVARAKDLATDLPAWIGYFPDAQTVEVNVLYEKAPGSSWHFYQQVALQRVLLDLQQLFPLLDMQEAEKNFQQQPSKDFWILGQDFSRKKSRKKTFWIFNILPKRRPRSPKVLDHSAPGLSRKLQGVEVAAPWVHPPLGVISFLQQMQTNIGQAKNASSPSEKTATDP